MKYALAFLLLTTSTHAETATVNSCTDHCWKTPVTYFTAAEIRAMKAPQYCRMHVVVPRMFNGKMEDVAITGYGLPNECKKVDHMPNDMAWNYKNPEIKE